MRRRGKYAVRLSGLTDGEHDFSFDLDKEFFSSLEQSELEDGRIHAEVVLEKKPGIFSLHFILSGEVEVQCDRCLENFLSPVESRQSIFVKLGETPGEIEDDVIMIHKDDHEIGVGQLMYEFIVLSLPYRRIHPEDENGEPACDSEMLRKLEDHSGGSEEDDGSDPRWDALKGIIGK